MSLQVPNNPLNWGGTEVVLEVEPEEEEVGAVGDCEGLGLCPASRLGDGG